VFCGGCSLRYTHYWGGTPDTTRRGARELIAKAVVIASNAEQEATLKVWTRAARFDVRRAGCKTKVAVAMPFVVATENTGPILHEASWRSDLGERNSAVYRGLSGVSEIIGAARSSPAPNARATPSPRTAPCGGGGSPAPRTPACAGATPMAATTRVRRRLNDRLATAACEGHDQNDVNKLHATPFPPHPKTCAPITNTTPAPIF
jgi:hypothetical protein